MLVIWTILFSAHHAEMGERELFWFCVNVALAHRIWCVILIFREECESFKGTGSRSHHCNCNGLYGVLSQGGGYGYTHLHQLCFFFTMVLDNRTRDQTLGGTIP